MGYSGLTVWLHAIAAALAAASRSSAQCRAHCQFKVPHAKHMQTEITRNVTETIQPVDLYPKGRQFLQDEDYLSVLRDLLNLSNILDDMEQTGELPLMIAQQLTRMATCLWSSGVCSQLHVCL